jgi:adenylate kinase family enzyme
VAFYIVLMGPQGAGKGVQAEFISKEHQVIQLSTGDLFRALKTRTDALAQEIQATMNAGKLVSDEQTNRMVAERLEQPDAANGAIFDGYPRTTAQAEWLDNYLASRGERLKTVILLELDLYIAFKRAFGRVKASNKESYNLYYGNEDLDIKIVDDPGQQFPPRIEAVLKSTGEKLDRRADDANAHAILRGSESAA